MTRLYLLRHGIADWPNWTRPDDERPLTEKGARQVQRVARALAKKGVKPELILSSPLPRARQTAEITAEALGLKVTEDPTLAPGFDAAGLQRLLSERGGKDLMLVGHEPDFSSVIKSLTGGSVVMAKAGIARVDFTTDDRYEGEL